MKTYTTFKQPQLALKASKIFSLNTELQHTLKRQRFLLPRAQAQPCAAASVAASSGMSQSRS